MEYEHKFSREKFIEAALPYSEICKKKKDDGSIVGVSGTQVNKKHFKLNDNGTTLYLPKNHLDDMLKSLLEHFNLIKK